MCRKNRTAFESFLSAVLCAKEKGSKRFESFLSEVLYPKEKGPKIKIVEMKLLSAMYIKTTFQARLQFGMELTPRP